MKTLFINPPSFEKFDGGASARYQATREITSFWYPVWLAYPAGLVPESRLLDGPARGIGPHDTVAIAQNYDLVVLYTSTAGFASDIRLAEQIKARAPGITIAFVGPHVTVRSEASLRASSGIDFVVRGEFDYAVAEFAEGGRLADIGGMTYRQDGRIVHNPPRQSIQDLDVLPFAVEVYKRDLDCSRYNIPYLLHPYVSFYTSRGCPALCTFCLWPQTMSGHPWRTRSVANVVEFDTGVNIENLVLDRDGSGRINSLLCRGQRRVPMRLKAKLFVFAVGAGFERYVQELRLSARLRVSHSAMVVAWPALSTVNFARLSVKPRFHFNHLLQHGVGKHGPIQFSMLANSSFLQRDAQMTERVADIDVILEAAERYFGPEALHARKLFTYECAKTGFLSDEEEKRRYSYWIEHPRDTNYLGVLPGKFSFFPTVAYQTYMRVKGLLRPEAVVNRPTNGAGPACEHLAKALVADPYPVQILSSHLDDETHLLMGAGQDLCLIDSRL